MLKLFWADLHIHTVLSGCAEVEMIPPLILGQANRLGLNLIAVADHNACHNAEAVIRASEGTGIHVLPGVEFQSREEVHLLCLFDTVSQCRQWQEKIFQKLPPLVNKKGTFGTQFVVNPDGEWIRTEERFLAGACDIGLEEAVGEVSSLGGMAIPAHVDRPSFSLLSNLGLIPDSLGVHGLEVTPQFAPETGFQKWPQLKNWRLIVNGDAHRLNEIQKRTLFEMESPAVREMILALKGEQGRRVIVEWPMAS
jgi:predicted metal-dependent phosphoesterase TrpH